MNWQYRNTVLGLCTLAFFITYFARLAFSPVVPFITEDFAISNTVIGFALSGMWIGYGLAQYPSGKLAERFGEKRVILVSVGGTGILSFLAAISPVFVVFMIGVVGIGVFAGLHYTVASTLLSRSYDDMGTAVGIHALGAPAAGLIAPIVSAWIGVNFGWRPAIASVCAFAIPTYILFQWRVKPTEPRGNGIDAVDEGEVDSFYSFLNRPTIAFTTTVAILAMFPINGLLSFLPTFLMDFYGYSPTLAAILFGAFFVARGFTQVGVGRISDRYARDAVVAVCLLIGTGGVLLFLAGPSVAVITIAVILFATGNSFFAALEPRILNALSEEERNAGFGVFRTVYVVGGSTGSIGVGALADLFGWQSTFIILGLIFLTSFLFVTANQVLKLGY